MLVTTLNNLCVCFVEVPEYSVAFEIYDKESIKTFLISYVKHSHFKPGAPVGIDLPPGNWQDPIRCSEVTEEIARRLVESGWYETYMNYKTGLLESFTALESFHSFLHANNITPDTVMLIERK